MRTVLVVTLVISSGVRALAQAPPARAVAAEAPVDVLARADAALAARRVDEAEALYARAAGGGQSVRALLGLARIQSGRGDPRQALATLERALALAPNAEDLLAARARVALAGRAPVLAILALEPLTRMVPSVMEYHYLLGVALMQAGDMPSAVFALQEALALEPNRALSLIALGLSFNNQKLYAEAKPPLVRSLEIEPDSLEALAALAEAEQGLGELAQADRHAQRVLAREPGHAAGNLVLGLVRMKQERYQEARGFLESAVASDPLSGKAHYQLSLACARLGDEACQRRELALYRSAQRQFEQNLLELRGAIGAQKGGMSP